MSYEESIKLLALIKLSYPNSYKDIDVDTQKATVNMWHKKFENVPFKIMELALDHFTNVSKFPPTVADIREELKGLYYEAMQNVLTIEETEQRVLFLYVMKYTESFAKGEDKKLKNIQNLLNGVNQPLIEG